LAAAGSQGPLCHPPAVLLVLIQFNNLFFARFVVFSLSFAVFCPVFLCCAAALLLAAEVEMQPTEAATAAATPAISANEIAFCVPQTL